MMFIKTIASISRPRPLHSPPLARALPPEGYFAGLAPQLVAEISNIVRELNQLEGVSILLAEQNTNIALRNADYGYIIESGHVMMHGSAESLRNDDKIKEFYLGISKEGRKNFRDVLLKESVSHADLHHG